MYVSPHGTRHCRHEKYREAWCQMACPRDEAAPTRLLVKRLRGYPFDACKLCNQKCPLQAIRMELTRDRRGRWQKSAVLAQVRRDQRNRHRSRMLRETLIKVRSGSAGKGTASQVAEKRRNQRLEL